MFKLTPRHGHRPYAAPRLKVYGDVVILTAGGSRPTNESIGNGKKN